MRCRSQWPRSLTRRSAAKRLLGLRVRVPPEVYMSVSCECLCCQVEVSATGRSLVQRSPTDCGVSECDQVKINNLDTYCEQVGRRGKDYKTRRIIFIFNMNFM